MMKKDGFATYNNGDVGVIAGVQRSLDTEDSFRWIFKSALQDNIGARIND